VAGLEIGTRDKKGGVENMKKANIESTVIIEFGNKFSGNVMKGNLEVVQVVVKIKDKDSGNRINLYFPDCKPQLLSHFLSPFRTLELYSE